jgi:hypothetical protein
MIMKTSFSEVYTVYLEDKCLRRALDALGYNLLAYSVYKDFYSEGVAIKLMLLEQQTAQQRTLSKVLVASELFEIENAGISARLEFARTGEEANEETQVQARMDVLARLLVPLPVNLTDPLKAMLPIPFNENLEKEEAMLEVLRGADWNVLDAQIEALGIEVSISQSATLSKLYRFLVKLLAVQAGVKGIGCT